MLTSSGSRFPITGLAAVFAFRFMTWRCGGGNSVLMEESMSKRGRPRNLSGAIYKRQNSAYWWVRYPNTKGGVEKESTGTTDRESAERFLRSRLEARDQ